MDYNTKIAFSTVIFPKNLPYFENFLSSLENQSYSDFRLIVVNDGCVPLEIEKEIKRFNLNFEIISVSSCSPAEIRLQLFSYLSSSEFEIIIFGDSDDFFSLNRVEDTIKTFVENNCDIVFSDLNRVSQDAVVLDMYLWRHRIKNKIINLDFLLDCNVLGLGNTAIKKHLLDTPILNPVGISAFDWVFYLQLFYRKPNMQVKFSDSQVFYRQHENNTLGISNYFSLEIIEQSFSTKKAIYTFIEQLGCIVPADKKNQVDNFENIFLKHSVSAQEEILKKIQKKTRKKNLFWFEETMLI